jgi:periplasmic protein TonB
VSGVGEQKTSRWLWVYAAVIAFGLHAGGAALAIAHLQGDEEGGDLGAQGTEVSLELTSPHTEVADLPPGPDADASVASPAMPEQKAVEKETDLPKAIPTEGEDPDRVVTTTENKKPKEDEPKVAAVQTSASQESVAQEATAQQVYENAKESPTSTVVNQGLGRDNGKLTANWGRRVSAYFNLFKKYPEDRKSAATVKVSLVLNRRGNVVSVNVLESSGDAAFDDAAISMIKRSDPVPVPPAALKDDQFAFNIDVNFKKPK